jgi:ribonuclease III
MKDIFHQVYNGFLRFIPAKKYFKFKSSHSSNLSVVGFLTEERKRMLEETLGIEIKHIELFEQALIHRSYLQVISTPGYLSNERLEFLGDSILGMIVSEHLFALHQEVLEGELTKMRSWIVNKNSLTLAAKKLKLDEFLMLSFSAEKSLKGGSDSILADAMEAIIAAIYLDSGIETTRTFIIDSILPIISKKNVMIDSNYKSLLLEDVQAQGHSSPVYNVIEEKGPDHDKEFTVGVYIDNDLYGIGKGKSKKQAEQFAAQEAIEKFNILQKNKN